MNLHKIKNQNGFTIVELFIVVVVIGILVAIIGVAYNSVQNNERKNQAQAAAQEYADKAEVFAGNNDGRYPSLDQLKAETGSGKLSDNIKQAGSNEPSQDQPIQYTLCEEAGVQINYFTYGTGSAAPITQGDTNNC